MNDPQGSNWRIWDLHIHTPESVLNNGFSSTFDEYVQRLFKIIVDKKIAVVGITDYFCIEGYKKIRKILNDEERLQSICGSEIAEAIHQVLFLPNIEFRDKTIYRDKEGKDKRINYHIIFSNIIEPEIIDDFFLRNLKFTADSSPGTSDEVWPLTIPYLEQMGERLKQEHKTFSQHSNLFVGMMTAMIDHQDVSKVLVEHPSRFKNKYLFACPPDEDLSNIDWNGQGHQARKIFIQKSDLLFTSNSGTRDFALGLCHSTIEEYLTEFKTRKPCIHGSDAHDYDHLFNPEYQRFTWIKADPTFSGLRQIINEPDSRVYIGLEPPALSQQRLNKTRYIDQISFTKNSNSSLREEWFSGSVPLNTGLIAIIGNKGNGKSALADCLGLLGNSTREQHFSFLHDSKFRQKRERKAEQFTASIKWLSGNLNTRKLSDKVDATSFESIKYIPQHYLEIICNEIASGEDSQFYKELKSVIFSHIPEDERLNCVSFDELISFKTNETKDHISILKGKIHNLNKKITSLNICLTDEYRESLEQKLHHNLNYGV